MLFLKSLMGLWLSYACYAHATPLDCRRLLSSPVVDQTIQPQYQIEIESAGTIAGEGKALPPLSTGHYIFLVTMKGELVISEQYDLAEFARTRRGLVTHKSLLKAYEEQTLESAADQIVAAGEFQVAFDHVARISNKSGNFRTGPERFEEALDYLTFRGLPITASTRVLPVDPAKPEDFGHTPKDRNVHEFRLQYMSEVATSAVGKRLLKLYEQFYFLIRRTFDPLSGPEAIVAMAKAKSAGRRISGHTKAYESLQYPFVTVYAVDGIHFGIHGVMFRTTIAKPLFYDDNLSRGAKDQIANILAGLKRKLPADLEQEWISLGERFESVAPAHDLP